MKLLTRALPGIISVVMVLAVTACSPSNSEPNDTAMLTASPVQNEQPPIVMTNSPETTTIESNDSHIPPVETVGSPSASPETQDNLTLISQAPGYPSSPVEIPEGIESVDVFNKIFPSSYDSIIQAVILDFETHSDLVMNYFLSRTADIAFIVTTEHGRYHFSDSEMTRNTVVEYVNTIETGIIFAKGWFETLGINFGEPLELFYVQDDLQELYGDGFSGIGGSTWMGKTFAHYDNSMSFTPYVASYVLTHEATHALCRKLNVTSDFPISPFGIRALEEGMATMVQLFFGHSIGMLHDAYMQQYTAYFGSADGALDDVSDVAIALHHLALRTIEEEDFNDTLTYGSIYPVLMSGYNTAASFQCYLLARGSIEDFLSVYSNHQTAASVYGKDMDGLIGEWLFYLEHLQSA